MSVVGAFGAFGAQCGRGQVKSAATADIRLSCLGEQKTCLCLPGPQGQNSRCPSNSGATYQWTTRSRAGLDKGLAVGYVCVHGFHIRGPHLSRRHVFSVGLVAALCAAAAPWPGAPVSGHERGVGIGNLWARHSWTRRGSPCKPGQSRIRAGRGCSPPSPLGCCCRDERKYYPVGGLVRAPGCSRPARAGTKRTAPWLWPREPRRPLGPGAGHRRAAGVLSRYRAARREEGSGA